MTQVIVLNGGSSAGKSSIARALQEILPGLWLMAVMAGRGVFLILEEVFLAGGAGQKRLRGLLGDLDVLWAGVRCDPLVAASREAARPDRVPGMAMAQAIAVHAGAVYDVEVDTTDSSPVDCARRIAEVAAGH